MPDLLDEEVVFTAVAAATVDRELPTWNEIRKRLNQLMIGRGVFGGCPLPVDHVPLIVEPRYPYQGLDGFQLDDEEEEAAPRQPTEFPADLPDDPVSRMAYLQSAVKETLHKQADDYLDDFEQVNVWFSMQRQAWIIVVRRKSTGKSCALVEPAWIDRYQIVWHTIGCALAWDVNAELAAQAKLKTLVSEHAFGMYTTVGAFLESSERSNVTYIFRKGRPTIVVGTSKSGRRAPLCTLCMHPVGYYAGTFAGSMTPTDEVISHLCLARGDEHRYWRQANQHPIWLPSAGI